MDQSLTVVLPLHNSERSLRKDVVRTLESASELTPLFEVLLVDNASTDDTFDVASELAAEYPQVRVVRRSRQGELAEAIEEIKRTITSSITIVHDGQSPVNPEQLRRIWTQQKMMSLMHPSERGSGVSFADLRRPAATQPLMAEAHRRLLGFQQLPQRVPSAMLDENQRKDEADLEAKAPRSGMGAIPPLPKSNLYNAISQFARGE